MAEKPPISDAQVFGSSGLVDFGLAKGMTLAEVRDAIVESRGG